MVREKSPKKGRGTIRTDGSYRVAESSTGLTETGSEENSNCLWKDPAIGNLILIRKVFQPAMPLRYRRTSRAVGAPVFIPSDAAPISRRMQSRNVSWIWCRKITGWWDRSRGDNKNKRSDALFEVKEFALIFIAGLKDGAECRNAEILHFISMDTDTERFFLFGWQGTCASDGNRHGDMSTDRCDTLRTFLKRLGGRNRRIDRPFRSRRIVFTGTSTARDSGKRTAQVSGVTQMQEPTHGWMRMRKVYRLGSHRKFLRNVLDVHGLPFLRLRIGFALVFLSCVARL